MWSPKQTPLIRANPTLDSKLSFRNVRDIEVSMPSPFQMSALQGERGANTQSRLPDRKRNVRKVRYSLVIPIFNEEAVLTLLLPQLEVLLSNLDGSAEIIFVDDGSRDGSLDILRANACKDQRYRIIELSRNFGHQAAITAGMEFAQGAAVIIMDADLQDPPSLVLEMIRKWQEGYDIVYAKRAVRESES